MRINLTDYFKTAGKEDRLLLNYEAESLKVGSASYPVSGKPIEITVKNIGNGKVSVSGSGSFDLKMPCDRCLTDVDVTVDTDFELTLNEPDGFTELSEDDESYMDGYELDGEAVLDNELIMGLPMKVLCKDDCKGLCPVCGSNRNEGECGCDTFVPDPRMAAIQDIFNANNKEV